MEPSESTHSVSEDQNSSPVGEDTLSEYELGILQSDSPDSAKWSSYAGSTTASKKCC